MPNHPPDKGFAIEIFALDLTTFEVLRELARVVEAGELIAFWVGWDEGDPILEVNVKRREGVDRIETDGIGKPIGKDLN